MARDEGPIGDDATVPHAMPVGGESTLDDQPAPGAGGGRNWLLITLGVVGILFVLYVVAVLTTLGGVPENTTVVGVQIGGMTVEDAATTLESELADEAAAPMTVTAGGVETAFDPTVVGLAMDYRATAESAAGPVFNPAQLFQHLTGQDVEVAPVVIYDQALMQEGIERVAQTADVPPAEPVITMDTETPTLSPGQAGQGIDQPAATALIASSYLVTTDPIALPVAAVNPTVSDEEAQRVLEEYATPAVSGPAAVRFDSTTETLTVDTIAAALSFSPADATLVPQLNLEVVRAGLPELAAAEQPGTDATWDVSSGTPVVVPSKQGRGVTDEGLSSQILAVLPNVEPEKRTAQLEIVPIDPSLTTEQAQALNITEQMSSFTQKFDYAEYRKVNVGQAAEYMNGVVLKPGDVYSMNGTILERTEANGYVEGTYISGGKFEQGLGGGVSIATTATWTAAFFAGLEAIEVNPHSLYISRYQPGLEATVAWGQLDLQFGNNSGNGVLITTESGDTFITVTMWGTKHYDSVTDESSERYNITPYPTKYDDSPDCTSQSGVNGFTIDVWRVTTKSGQEVGREKFHTVYDPTTKYVCSPPPTQSTGSSPSPSG